MKTLPALLLTAFWALPALACDRVDAAKVHFALAEMGVEWSEQGARVTVEVGRAWDGAAVDRRLRLLQTFARADACLAGSAREVAFHRDGRLVGSALAGGVELVPDPVRSAGAATPAAACQ